MTGWLRTVLVAVALMVGTWALLVLLALRLPPGLRHDQASIVPDCVTTIRRCAATLGSRVGSRWWSRWRGRDCSLRSTWVPEFLPVVGRLDDVLVVALALRYAPARCCSPPGLGGRLLERLLGGRAPTPG